MSPIKMLAFLSTLILTVSGCTSASGLIKDGFSPMRGSNLVGKTLKYRDWGEKNRYFHPDGLFVSEIFNLGNFGWHYSAKWTDIEDGYCQNYKRVKQTYNEESVEAIQSCTSVYIKGEQCKAYMDYERKWIDCEIHEGLAFSQPGVSIPVVLKIDDQKTQTELLVYSQLDGGASVSMYRGMFLLAAYRNQGPCVGVIKKPFKEWDLQCRGKPIASGKFTRPEGQFWATGTDNDGKVIEVLGRVPVW